MTAITATPRWRLGVDIGGTFTDVALESAGGTMFTAKTLTTPDAPERAVLDAIGTTCADAGIGFDDVDVIIHGTTLATNALIERRGAEMLFVTTEGFRDVLEMGTESRFDQYDLGIVKPAPLVRRARRFTVTERLDVAGEVLVPLDEATLAPVIDTIDREGIESVAVGLLHAYANPAHERRIRELLLAHKPDLSISLSSEVSPEMREYQRFSTTVANAYVQPVVATYLRSLEDRLAEAGFRGALMAMLSNGGLADIDTAIRFPVRLIESGPAGGAIFSSHVARRCGVEAALSFDMGGTTAKICLIDAGRPQTAREFEVDRAYRFKRGSGLPLRIPVVEMVEIGAGGGSLCSVNALGMVAVGPRSAGSDPGPACYGRGGTGATVTDANLIVGRIDPDGFAGGTVPLTRQAADDAIDRDVGALLGLDTEGAAVAVLEMVDENMANATREHAIEHGKSPEGRILIAFGGCAPLHAARVALKLGIDHVIVPAGAGVGSAIGFLRAPVAYEVARSLYQRLPAIDPGAIDTLLTGMADEAGTFVRRASGAEPETFERFGFMRYVGQSHEIMVDLPDGAANPDWAAAIQDRYQRAYRAQFGPAIPGLAIEVVAWSVRAVRPAACWEGQPGTPIPTDAASPVGTRRTVDTASGVAFPTAIYRRTDLPPGAMVAGGAVIGEDQTSTVLPPTFDLRVDGFGYLHLERNGRTGPAAG
jgi:N-methylhydantoinase A